MRLERVWTGSAGQLVRQRRALKRQQRAVAAVPQQHAHTAHQLPADHAAHVSSCKGRRAVIRPAWHNICNVCSSSCSRPDILPCTTNEDGAHKALLKTLHLLAVRWVGGRQPG